MFYLARNGLLSFLTSKNTHSSPSPKSNEEPCRRPASRTIHPWPTDPPPADRRHHRGGGTLLSVRLRWSSLGGRICGGSHPGFLLYFAAAPWGTSRHRMAVGFFVAGFSWRQANSRSLSGLQPGGCVHPRRVSRGAIACIGREASSTTAYSTYAPLPAAHIISYTSLEPDGRPLTCLTHQHALLDSSALLR